MSKNIIYKDREDAAIKLSDFLTTVINTSDEWIVIAIASGAVVLADRVVRKLENSSLELLFIESIPAPNNKECTIAMVSETQEIVMNTQLVQSFNINLDYIYGEANRKHEEKLLPYTYKYRKGETLVNLTDKNVILVDEGIESGLTMMTAIKTIMSLKAKTISIATPLIPLNLINVFESVADEVYALHKISNFLYVDSYYEEFEETNFEKINKIISSNPKFRKEWNEPQSRVRY